MQQDYAVSLNQRSYLLDAVKKRYKQIGADFNSEDIWHISGRISLMKYRYLLRLLFRNENEELVKEINNLIKEASHVRN